MYVVWVTLQFLDYTIWDWTFIGPGVKFHILSAHPEVIINMTTRLN